MICTVVGARPNFMKMAPIVLEGHRRGLRQLLVHTGQHYDEAMSAVFFEQLGMPAPDVYLGVGSGTHAVQTAQIMTLFEAVCLRHEIDLVLVGGDVNSTFACAVTAAKLHIPVGHVEAGLRSFDRSMPEEINRILTDHVSDLLFTSEKAGTENLLREGFTPGSIHFVGNCMIDSLRAHLGAALTAQPWTRLELRPEAYALVTLHRPGAVDDPAILEQLRLAMIEVACKLPVVFPMHPRTRARIRDSGRSWDPVRIFDPLGYVDFLGLMAKARLVLTDSGGIQEETTALGVPCLTLRPNTERPSTIEVGTNRLVGTDYGAITGAVGDALSSPRRGGVPDLWDGHAAERILDVLSTKNGFGQPCSRHPQAAFDPRRQAETTPTINRIGSAPEATSSFPLR